jgi:hypothetical protein
MKILLLSLSLCLFSCKGFEALTPIELVDRKDEEHSDKSSITEEMGGSNYAFIELGRYAQDPTEENWMADVKTPVVHYHQYQQKVRQQLDDLIRNGQKKIAIPIWFGGPNLGCESHGHTVCPQNGKLTVTARTNLLNLLADISSRPFKEIQLRIGGQGTADVNGWTQFEETLYENNRSFIFDVVETSEAFLAGKTIKIYYDLGLEMMGHPFLVDKPWVKEYLRRIWAHYVQSYDPQKTVGFSFNHVHREAAYESLKIFDDSGVRPARLAIDLYLERMDYLQNLQWVLILKGWGKNYPVYIQETYRNNRGVANEIKDAIQNLGLNIRTIMQWPLDEDSVIRHTNSTDYRFDNYK